MSMESICFKNITKRYGDKLASDNLTFSVNQGEVFGILGPNGAGKTTAINQLMGLLKIDQGSIRVLDKNPLREWREVRRLIGLVPQETALYPELSGKQNLEFQAALYLKNIKDARKRIDEILELVDLVQRKNDPVATYSGGMKRRLAIGRALIHNPVIMILDEPTLGVDVQGTHKIWDYIKNLAREGKTILLSTNVMAEADFLCNRILIIDHGKRIALGAPEELKKALGRNEIIISLKKAPTEIKLKTLLNRQYQIKANRIYIKSEKGSKDLLEIINKISGKLDVEEITLKQPTLDDVFLHYTGRSLRD